MSRLLVVANRTCPCPGLLEDIVARTRTEGEHEVRLIAPALNSRLRHLVSDVDQAVLEAHRRLEHALHYLRDAGVTAGGEVGDSDPFMAVQDTLRVFPADMIIISTHPAGRSNWLERNLIERVRRAFGVPVTHEISHYGLEAVSTGTSAPGR